MLIERLIAGAILTAAAITGAAALLPESPPVTPPAATIPVTATAIPLDRDDPARTQAGALRFAGAVEIRSANPAFGGLSGLRSSAGDRMLAISDTGNWLAFTTVERGGRLIGVTDMTMAALPQPDGKPAQHKSDVDAEALEHDPVTGDTSIVYEQAHRIAHFTRIDAGNPATLARPPESTEYLTAMTGWPANGGGEAMAVLPGGSRIILSEDARRPDGSIAALITTAGKTREIGVETLAGYRPTDAIALDDHRILLLQRRFSPLGGLAAALALVDLTPALAGIATAPLPQTLLATLAPPVNFDNMEGLALRRSGGRTFVYLVSDDNLNAAQRTLLMKFELPAGL